MQESKLLYRISPTLLNNWSFFKEDAPFMKEGAFLSRLNRESRETSFAMTRGNKFEAEIMNPGTHPDEKFPAEVVNEFVKRTQGGAWQVPVYYLVEIPGTQHMARIGGFMDVVGRSPIAYDIKTTKYYQDDAFLKKWQHKCYLIGLDKVGSRIDRFEYLITDFEDWFVEGYDYRPEHWLAELKDELYDFHCYVQRNAYRINPQSIYVSTSK